MKSMPTHVSDRLTRDERMKIYQWTGEGYSTGEIARMFNRDKPGHAKIRIPGVEKVLAMPEAMRFVSKFRLEFIKSLKDIPISEKKIRLADLEKLRQRLMYLIDNSRMTPTGDKLFTFLRLINTVSDILERARNEMEQRPGVAIGIGINQGDLGELTDEQLKAKHDELLRRAAGFVNRRTAGVDEDPEGDEGAPPSGSPEILLAPPEELRRDPVQAGEPDVPDVRPKDGDDTGLPAV